MWFTPLLFQGRQAEDKDFFKRGQFRRGRPESQLLYDLSEPTSSPWDMSVTDGSFKANGTRDHLVQFSLFIWGNCDSHSKGIIRIQTQILWIEIKCSFYFRLPDCPASHSNLFPLYYMMIDENVWDNALTYKTEIQGSSIILSLHWSYSYTTYWLKSRLKIYFWCLW